MLADVIDMYLAVSFELLFLFLQVLVQCHQSSELLKNSLEGGKGEGGGGNGEEENRSHILQGLGTHPPFVLISFKLVQLFHLLGNLAPIRLHLGGEIELIIPIRASAQTHHTSSSFCCAAEYKAWSSSCLTWAWGGGKLYPCVTPTLESRDHTHLLTLLLLHAYLLLERRNCPLVGLGTSSFIWLLASL